MGKRKPDCLSDQQKALIDNFSAQYRSAVDKGDELLEKLRGKRGQARRRLLAKIEEQKAKIESLRTGFHDDYGPWCQSPYIARRTSDRQRRLYQRGAARWTLLLREGVG